MPLVSIGNISPYERLFGSPPNNNHLRVFSCLCFTSTPKPRHTKFDSRAESYIFVGYPHGQKAYKVYNTKTKKFFISRDIRFFKHHFPHHTSPHPKHQSFSFTYPCLPLCLTLILTHLFSISLLLHLILLSLVILILLTLPFLFLQLLVLLPPSFKKSTKQHTEPSYLLEYYCNLISHHGLPFSHHFLVASHSQWGEPKTYKTACKNPAWMQAMNSKLQALEANNTWILVILPPSKKAIGSK